MAIPHLSVRVQSRSRGQSMARALAYRCGLSLVDVRTGRTHDYTRRRDREEIAHTGLGRFDNLDPSWTIADTQHAQLLADRVETAERRVNSTIARDFEAAIPHELDDAQQLALAREWCDFLAARFHTPVPFAIHRPARDGDQRNVHIHALMPDRVVATDGVTMGAKLRVLGDRVDRGPKEILELRLAWQNMVNAHLQDAGVDASIDMGRTRPADQPSVHAGPRRTGRERRRQRDAKIAPDGRGVLARAAEFETARRRRRSRRARASVKDIGRRLHRGRRPRGRGRGALRRRRLSVALRAPRPRHRRARIGPNALQHPTEITLRAARQATGARRSPDVDNLAVDLTEPQPPRGRRRRRRERAVTALRDITYAPPERTDLPAPRERSRTPSPPVPKRPAIEATRVDVDLAALRAREPARRRRRRRRERPATALRDVAYTPPERIETPVVHHRTRTPSPPILAPPAIEAARSDIDLAVLRAPEPVRRRRRAQAPAPPPRVRVDIGPAVELPPVARTRARMQPKRPLTVADLEAFVRWAEDANRRFDQFLREFELRSPARRTPPPRALEPARPILSPPSVGHTHDVDTLALRVLRTTRKRRRRARTLAAPASRTTSKKLATKLAKAERRVARAVPREFRQFAAAHRMGHVDGQPPRVWPNFDLTKWNGNPDTTIRYVLKSTDGRTQHGGSTTVRRLAQLLTWAYRGDPLDADGAELKAIVRNLNNGRDRILAEREREAEIKAREKREAEIAAQRQREAAARAARSPPIDRPVLDLSHLVIPAPGEEPEPSQESRRRPRVKDDIER